MTTPDPILRGARPADYDSIAAVVDEWWGRPVLPALPRLFLDHFHRTSLVASRNGGRLVGFLVGFPSPAQPDRAYIHFVGVHPEARGRGLARTMYERFFRIAGEHGCRTVTAITSPGNRESIDFHGRMGFAVHGPVPGYNGPGRDSVVFARPL
jgi:ribosomal protein S18 acetylase RimI-like enzyme